MRIIRRISVVDGIALFSLFERSPTRMVRETFESAGHLSGASAERQALEDEAKVRCRRHARVQAVELGGRLAWARGPRTELPAPATNLNYRAE